MAPVRVLLAAIVLAAAAPAPGYGQDVATSPEAENAFQEALRMFVAHDYASAAPRFHAIALVTPAHQRVTAALVMEAQAYYRLGQPDETESAARRLLTGFPGSAYAPDARYLVGLATMLRHDYDGAAAWIAQAWSSAVAPVDSSLRSDARLVLGSIIDEELNGSQVRDLADRTPGGAWIRAKAVERFLKEGDRRSARAEFDKVRAQPDAGVTAAWMADVQARLERTAAAKIGVLLPKGSSGAVKALAADVLDGITFALEQRRGRTAADLVLDVREHAADSAAAAAAAAQLASDSDVVAVLGPLFSTEALAAAHILNAARLPMISPTAQADGLAATGPYCVQLNPDQQVRGAAMARYAVEQLGYRRLAVLTAADPHARLRAESFRAAAAALGAEVVAFETFAAGTTDLRDQFMKIREAGAAREPSVSFAGRTTAAEVRRLVRAGADPDLIREARRRNESVPVTRLFGPRGLAIADSLGLRLMTPELHAEDLDVPVTTLDGLYISLASSDDIDVVAPQISYFNIRTQLLGSEEWNDPGQLAANRRYAENMLIAVDAFVESEDSAYAAFEGAFRKWKGAAPGRNTLYGYDAMNLLLDVISRGGASREAVGRLIAGARDEGALHLPLRLVNRVNTAMHIIKYERGSVKLLRTVASQ